MGCMLLGSTLKQRFEQVAVQAAAGRLRRQGLIIELDGGIVRYPDRGSALAGQLTPRSIADARLIARKHLVAATARVIKDMDQVGCCR